MRRIIVIAAALLFSIAAFADYPTIRNIDISVSLQRDGSANISEVWDVRVTEGTEWYLVRNNLGDISIENLSVSDESGLDYINEGRWDVDRSISKKAGRCGLHYTGDGVEICWGLGTYGDHVYTVSYTMTNAVKSLSDADMLHLQLVSPGLSSRPKNVKVRISNVPDSTRFWGFGFVGESFKDGEDIVFESSESFSRKSSVIVLLRFEKGFFNSSSVRNRGFEEVLAKALEGSRFEDEKKDRNDFLEELLNIFLISLPFLIVFGGLAGSAASKRRILGCKPSKVEWSREVPYDGDLQKSNYTLKRLGETGKAGNTYASALILRMIYSGAIQIIKKDEKKIDLAFNDSKAGALDANARGLYDMMKDASGKDEILQEKEFSKWSRRNYRRVNKWIESSLESGRDSLEAASLIEGQRYTPKGQAEARKLLGFKKFLNDFTLVGERTSREVGLWQDYLVFASIFGIADKVAKELHDIDPQFFEEVMAYDFNTVNWILWRNSMLSNSITNAQVRAADAMSRSSGSFGGFGGGTSFGGGGGFSGGGFGGGAR